MQPPILTYITCDYSKGRVKHSHSSKVPLLYIIHSATIDKTSKFDQNLEKMDDYLYLLPCSYNYSNRNNECRNS